jgi:hypothetical protein
MGLLSVMGVGLATFGVRDAHACGGEFVNPDENDSVVTDHRMILSISPQQTTLYDEIEFTGVASSFAWVLPIKGTATVGLSADLVFSSLDSLTETEVAPPPTNCPPPPNCESFFGVGSGTAEGAAALAADAGHASATVTVTEQQQVGPYETVQLHSSDPGALNAWLTAHGYAIPASAASVVSAYVADGFDFLAMKLAPGQGVTAMRPVRVTTSGASPALPLRMVSIGTGATTGITLWVIADGRYEPQNFPFFQITDSELSWDWNTGASNYDTVRLAKEAALKGSGWEVESSLELAQYSLVSLVESGGSNFRGPVAASGAYLAVGDAGADAGGGDDDGEDAGDAAAPPVTDGGPESADQVRQADLTALFAGIAGPNARVTRIRSDIAHAALGADLQLQASSDQSEVSNIHNPTKEIGEPLCPVFNESCEQTGEAPRSQAEALSEASGSSTSGMSAGLPGGCSTTEAGAGASSRTALGLFAGLLGFTAVWSRRRRSTSQKSR